MVVGDQRGPGVLARRVEAEDRAPVGQLLEERPEEGVAEAAPEDRRRGPVSTGGRRTAP
ncbi:hypothetical protein ABZ532_16100 [Streptomyces sp. NPDC019396]|uniref:hypothetical protein n=1 Tax=Streptomyces sp. NPDC019396 TaxID=3154687 RepID=UPI0033DF6EAE